MTAPGFYVDGLDELLARFRAAPRIFEEELEDAGDTILAQAISRLAAEPSPPAGSRYVRTHRLSRGWRETDRRYVVAGNSRSIVLRNPTPYLGWVQVQATQATVHKGRWETIEEAQTAVAPFAEQKLAEAGANTAARLAGGK